MARIVVVLSIDLTYHEDAVRSSEDFELTEEENAQEYLSRRIGSFIESEINNTKEFPATAFVHSVRTLS